MEQELHRPMNEIYLRIADMFIPLAIVHRLTFALTAAVVLRGNRNPGRRLLSLAFASMAFSVFYTMQSADFLLLAAGFFVLVCCLLYDAYQPMTAWGPGAHLSSWARKLAWVILAWAVCDPRYSRPAWLSPLISPFGVLPGPALLALLAMLWLAFPQTNRLVHWAAALLGLLTAIRELWLFRSFFDIPLLAFSGLTLYGLSRAVHQSGGATEDDLTPQERIRPSQADAQKDRVWKI